MNDGRFLREQGYAQSHQSFGIILQVLDQRGVCRIMGNEKWLTSSVIKDGILPP